MDLNQTDLILRLQKLKCCIATLSSELVSKIKIGAPTVDCKLRDLQALIGMYESVKCYDLTTTGATGSITIDNVGFGWLVEFFVDGVTICGEAIVITNSSESTQLSIIINAINSYQTDYVASVDSSGTYKIKITSSDCTNEDLTYSLTGSGEVQMQVSVDGLSGGDCNLYNCLTESQVKSILDYAAVKCEHCFTLTN